MRRSDREITDEREIISILERCDVCRLAIVDGDEPYIVPLSFGFTHEDGHLTLYFHSAAEGRKLDVISKNDRACFEVDCSARIITGEKPCDYTTEYESVIGFGRIEIDATRDEKCVALRHIMRKYAPEGTEFAEFPDAMLDRVLTFRLVVSGVTGKRNLQ